MDTIAPPVHPPHRTGQTYRNHWRWYPPVHFFVEPLFGLNAIFALVRLVREPTLDRGWQFALAVGLLFIVFTARWQVLAVQDRLIRLEMWLRLRHLLPPDLQPRIGELRTGQLLALRFAPDEELPELVRATLAGELGGKRAIKRAIRSWRGDYLRA
ncbi:MAG TPA: DUF6526 family protein [Longimicrobiaceae bacterium]|nr:DUF6526 family protein [Longimicrobiaceae bacterium]